MAKNILVINVELRETRVCLIEDGIIAELHIERETQKGALGNIYLGKVSRVLPGMQAAFIDIGLERAAFLHVEDLIRPADFDAYLGGKRPASDEDREAGIAPEDAAGDGEPTGEAAATPTTGENGNGKATPAGADEGGSEGRRRRGRRRSGRGRGRQDAEATGAEAQLKTEAKPEATPTDSDDDDEVLVAAPQSHVPAPPSQESLDRGWDEADEADVDDDMISAGAIDHAPAEDADAHMGEAGNAIVDDSAADDSAADDSAADDSAADDSAADDSAAEPEEENAAADGAASEPPPAPESVSEADFPAVTIEDADPETIASASASAQAGPGAPSEEGADGAAQATDDQPAQVATRSGRSSAKKRSTRVRRSGSTRDRPGAKVDATPAPAEPSRSDRDRGERNDRDRGERSDRDRGDRGRGRRHGGSGDRGPKGSSSRRTRNDPLRVSKATPIRDVVREGQDVVVQVSKEPIGTKGARVTSHISLPGRYVVYLPTVDHIGISKRIGSEKERGRLREAIDAMRPPSGGLIVRTLAEGLTKKALKADVGYLVRLWGEICKAREGAVKAPEIVYTELDLVLKTARDLFTDDIEKIVIDDRDEYIRLRRFVEMFMPERADAIEYYEGEEPIFDAYGIEDEIGRALSRKVPLHSGGHLIIDQAEALTAIDVNTGRYIGKGSKDLEDTILTTNMEAVEEIAYQLRFRNIGGLIILDLIDMERAGSREKVRRTLEQLLAKDKAKTTLNRISDLGLIEMTRKRTRESLGRTMHEPCFYCDGTGQLQSKQTIGYEILRQIKRERMTLSGYVVVVNAHPAVIDLLKNEERAAVQETEKLYMRRIDLVPRKEYHLEQFDLIGK